MAATLGEPDYRRAKFGLTEPSELFAVYPEQFGQGGFGSVGLRPKSLSALTNAAVTVMVTIASGDA